MKFKKGMNEGLLWEFLEYNIWDYFHNLDGKFIDYSNQSILNKILSNKEGLLKKDVEIIVKINGKVQPDWSED